MTRLKKIYQLAISKPHQYDLFPKHIPKVLVIGRAIIFNKKKEILLLQRSESEFFDQGKWEIPGGKFDKDESDLIDATRREVEEETSITIMPTRIFVVTIPTDPDNKKYPGFVMLNYIEIAHVISDEVTLSEEHKHYKWVRIEKLNRDEMAGPTMKIIDYYLERFGN